MNDTSEIKIVDLNIGIGKRLRELRESKEWSQKNFIKKPEQKGITITDSTYSRYECGQTPIPAPYLKVFCDYFSVTTDYLINNIEKEKISPDKEITKILNLFTADEKKLYAVLWQT